MINNEELDELYNQHIKVSIIHSERLGSASHVERPADSLVDKLVWDDVLNEKWPLGRSRTKWKAKSPHVQTQVSSVK